MLIALSKTGALYFLLLIPTVVLFAEMIVQLPSQSTYVTHSDLKYPGSIFLSCLSGESKYQKNKQNAF
jgi:hypothetical protein